MTRIEIIDETAAFYNLGNRSVDEYAEGCLYNGPDGKQCAFARMCIDPSDLPEGVIADNILREYGECILKSEYRGHPALFYRDIQALHDDAFYWTETGLSKEGINRVKYLKQKWA